MVPGSLPQQYEFFQASESYRPNSKKILRAACVEILVNAKLKKP